MKWFHFLTVMLLGICLAACANTQTQDTRTADELSNAEVYRVMVDENARRRNVDVHWFRPPRDQDMVDHSTKEEDNGS